MKTDKELLQPLVKAGEKKKEKVGLQMVSCGKCGAAFIVGISKLPPIEIGGIP
jgi:hypothetical protein